MEATMRLIRRAGVLLVLAVAGAMLTVYAPMTGALHTLGTAAGWWKGLAGPAPPDNALAAAGAMLAAVSTAGAWVCLGWIGVVLAATVLGTGRGRSAALGRRLGVWCVPALARPALAALLGLALAGPGSGVAPALAAAHPVSVVDTPADPLGDLTLDWPRAATSGRPHPGAVVVRPGDTLWSLAAARLGAAAPPRRIAVEWPRWWAANRALIGSDPDLIHPGQRLEVPRPAG
jgi:nucleoid-associated protein YgaU